MKRMNEIESQFFNSFVEYMKNDKLCINNKIFKLDKEDFGYQLNQEDGDIFFIFDFKVQPTDKCFSGYIPDFAILINGAEQGYVIEIDGHEWHEKTKEQAKADKEKDRTYLKNNFIPVRFTGSEVYHNADNCIREIFEIMIKLYTYFEYDTINGLYEGEKLAANHTAEEIEELQEKVYQLCYGKMAKKAIFISKGNIELTPNITETA